MGCGDIAQGGAAGEIRPVAVSLDWHPRLLTDGLKHRPGYGVRGVALVGVVLDDDAAAQHRELPLVGVLRVGGVDGVGVVCRHHEAVGDGRLPRFAVKAAAVGDPLQHIGQEGGIRPLTGVAAHLFVVEHRQHRQAPAGLCR